MSYKDNVAVFRNARLDVSFLWMDLVLSGNLFAARSWRKSSWPRKSPGSLTQPDGPVVMNGDGCGRRKSTRLVPDSKDRERNVAFIRFSGLNSLTSEQRRHSHRNAVGFTKKRVLCKMQERRCMGQRGKNARARRWRNRDNAQCLFLSRTKMIIRFSRVVSRGRWEVLAAQRQGDR